MTQHFGLLAAVSAAFLLLTTPTRAQFQVGWFQTFDGPAHTHDAAIATAVDGAGSVYVAANGGTGLAFHGILQKYAPDGALAWSRDVSGAEGVSGLALDPASGDAVVVGTGPYALGFGRDAVVARYAPDGTRRWFRRWSTPGSLYDSASSVIVGAGGVAYVAAVTYPPGDDDIDVAVLAYSESGALDFESVLGVSGSSGSAPSQIELDAAGNLVVTGYTGSNSTDALVIQVDPAGGLAWLRAFDGPGAAYDRGIDVASDGERNVFVCGVTTMDSADVDPDYAGFLAKYDSAGNLLWQRIVDDPVRLDDSLSALEVDYQGNAVVAGWKKDAAGSYAWLGKFDPLGNLLWERTWTGDDEHDEGWHALDVDAGGGIAVAGASFRYLDYPGVVESDVEVRRYDKDGNLRWAHSGLYSVPNSDSPGSVAFGPNGTIAYAGRTNSVPGGQTDILVALLREQAVPFCFGDGSAAACPCGNASDPGDQVGCESSHGAGMKLVDSGSASISGDTLSLTASALPGSIAVFVQAMTSSNGGQGAAFGDGVSCLGGTPFRLGVESVVGGVASHPGAGDPPISVRGSIVNPGPRYYQVWFRDPASFCIADTFNLTSGLALQWAP